MQLIYGTGNPAKLNSMRKRLQTVWPQLELLGLQDLQQEVPEAPECGSSPLENAREKALCYYHTLGCPVFSCDSGLYLEGLPEELQPGVHVRNQGGKRMTDEEMIDYYGGLVKKYGPIQAQYRNAICLVLDEEEIYEAEVQDAIPFLLTDKPHPRRKEGFPLDSISLEITTGKYFYDLTAEEKQQIKQKQEEKDTGELDVLAVQDEFVQFFQRVFEERKLSC